MRRWFGLHGIARALGMLGLGAALAGGGVAVLLFFMLILAVPAMLLWNWLMPEIFGLGRIGYLQTLGLMILARLLIGVGGSASGRSD